MRETIIIGVIILATIIGLIVGMSGIVVSATVGTVAGASVLALAGALIILSPEAGDLD